MKNFAILKVVILLSALLGLASCYSPKTHGAFISEHQDAWIDGYAIRLLEPVYHLFYSHI